MASKIKVDQIEGQSGTTVTLPSGQTLDLSSGSVTLPNNAVDLASAKVTGTIPTSKGGTGLTSLGSANQVVAVNSGASALEFQTVSSEKAIKQVVFSQTSTRFNSTSGSYVATPVTMTITPTSASSKILIWCRMAHATLSDNYPRYKWYRKIGSGSFSALNTEPANSNGGASLGAYLNMRHNPQSSNEYEMQQVTDFFQDTTHNTTSAITYTLYGVCENGGEFFVNTTDHNEGGHTNDYNQVGTSNMMAWEMTV